MAKKKLKEVEERDEEEREEEEEAEEEDEEKPRKKKKWFDTGFGNVKKEDEKEQERIAANRKDQVWRFYLRPNTEAQIIFLDDDPTCFHEHRLWINGQNHFFTCREGFGRCPLCENGETSAYVGALSVIVRETTDKKGRTYKNQRRLFVARASVLKKLERKQERYGLEGQCYTAARGDEKSVTTGDDFEHEGEVKLGNLKDAKKNAVDVTPYNYEEILAPMSAEEMEKALKKIGYGEAPPEDDEEVPF